MKKNLSEATLKSAEMVAIVPENETALGTKHRQEMQDKYGIELANRLLGLNTMMTTIQEVIDKVYMNTSIAEADKESYIRENYLRPIALHTTAFRITDIARKCRNNEYSVEVLTSVGEWEVNKTVDRLTVKFDKETQKMRVHDVMGKPIDFYSSYMKNSPKKIYDFVGKKTIEGINNSESTVISLVDKGRKNGFCGRKELIAYATIQLYSEKIAKAEKMGKKIKDAERTRENIKEKVEGIYDIRYTDSFDRPLGNDESDDYTLGDLTPNKKADFVNDSIDYLDGTTSNNIVARMMNTTYETIKESAEKKARMYGTNIADEIEFGVALYFTATKNKKSKSLSSEESKNSIEDLRYQMSEFIPSFNKIINKYGETYSDIAKVYIVNRNLSSITNTALCQQGDTLREKVEADVRAMLLKKAM